MITENELRLYFIMGSCDVTRDPWQVLQEAIDGGITLFQYREKGEGAKTDAEKLRFGKELRALCKKGNIPFVVNDDIELAIELEADGLHVGQEDASISEIRKRLSAPFPVGVSVSTVEEAVLAERQGASYVGIGPVFSTETKPGKEPIGIEIIREIKSHINIPITAIGGITSKTAFQIKEAGASGVSVISAISKARNSKEAASELLGQVSLVS